MVEDRSASSLSRVTADSPAWDDAGPRRVDDTRPVGHVHVHAPHELTEHPQPAPPGRAERRLELAAVLLLALTTLATAWCGYQAARWSGEQSQALRARLGHPHQGPAGEPRAPGSSGSTTSSTSTAGSTPAQAGDARLAAIYRARFRPSSCPRSARGSRSGPSPTRGRSRDRCTCRSTGPPTWRAARSSTPPPTSSTRRGPRRRAPTTVHPLHGLLRRGAVLRRHLAAARLAAAADRRCSAWRCTLLIGGVVFVLTLPVA